MFRKELGIIGLGKIGSTILRVLINSKTIEREKIIIHDIKKDILQEITKENKVDYTFSYSI